MVYINPLFEQNIEPKDFAKIVTYSTVCDMWQHSVNEYGDLPSIYDNGTSYSFNKIDEDISHFRAVLASHNLSKGDYVGIYIKNSYDFVKAYLAAVTSGIVAVLLPPHLNDMTVFGCTMKFRLKGIVYGSDLEANLGIARAKNPALAYVNASENSDATLKMADVKEEDPCAVLFTGGTTGQSKGALLSHRAMMRGTRNGCFGNREVFYQKYYLVLPLTHVFGLIRNLMTCLCTGSELAICRNNKDMFREMLVFKPTVLVFVPALAEMALNLSKQFGRNMLGDSVKYVICGAAAVPAYLKKEYKKYGVTLYSGYGLTESANLAVANPVPDYKGDSIGIPFPEQECKIVDGELWLKGPNMMEGYVGDEEANKAAYSEDGWFKTGDLVRVDDEGFYYVIGRIKELIVLPTGENISPAEYENKFNQLDLVQDSLIYESTEDGKSMLVLEVYPRYSELAKVEAEDKNAYLKGLLGDINMTLPAFARVSKIIIRENDFKRSPSMKILRNQQ